MALQLIISPEVEAVLRSEADAAASDLASYAARQLKLMAAPHRSLK